MTKAHKRYDWKAGPGEFEHAEVTDRTLIVRRGDAYDVVGYDSESGQFTRACPESGGHDFACGWSARAIEYVWRPRSASSAYKLARAARSE